MEVFPDKHFGDDQTTKFDELECSECSNVKRTFKGYSNLDNVLTLHLDDLIIKGKKGPEKSSLRQSLHKIICALQNSKGGALILHLSHHKPGDRFLEHFDEFIQGIFPKITASGDMAADIYSRQWLWDNDCFFEYKTFVLLLVQPIKGVSTVEFNTKIRNDIENLEPTAECILSCLFRAKDHSILSCFKISNHYSRKLLEGIPIDVQYLHESRHIELKRFPSINIKKTDPSEIVHHFWYDLKLRHNVTSMSKIVGGGTIYFGISEQREKSSGFQTMVPIVEGFQLDIDHDDFICRLRYLASKHLIVLTKEGTFCEAPEDLLKIKLHLVSSKKYVLEVAVRYLEESVVFSDVQGPRAYKIVHNNIVRMTRDDWYERLLHLKTKDS